MLNTTEVRAAVLTEISSIVLEETDESVTPAGSEELQEIGLHSLLLARLIVQLEARVGADPFTDGTDSIVDMRTVDQLVAAYERGVTKRADTAVAA